ncbi:MAG TPA: T9SS type A sorting domain-containing protein, partial [Prolixibacteraceae bacterium]|nr:T9SS type A sorting domain-containing protein [Prolixibacteraceae bacterium]
IDHDFHPSLNTHIEILNVEGISVLKRNLSQINGRLSLTNLPKGIYFVQLSNSEWKNSLKLIVM